MPIRFRCAYCNQLLGISRRKAGTVVRCPTCAGQVVVPTVNGGEDKTDKESGAALFEHIDLDDIFTESAGTPDEKTRRGGQSPPSASSPPAGAWGTNADPKMDVPRVEVPRAAVPNGGPNPPLPAGIVLSPTRATLLTVFAVIALAIAFGAGVLVGRFL
jgi:phage FluMu protein Com